MDIEIDFLKPVPDYEGYYASDTGNIFSERSGSLKLLALHDTDAGYLTCTLYAENGKIKKVCKVHRLVISSWIENPDNLPSVDHIDSNKKNNRLDNLNWVSVKENNNRVTNRTRYTKCIIQATLKGEFIAEFKSIADASRATNITSTAITKVLKKKGNTAGGFTWFYKEDFKENNVKKHGSCRKVEQYTLDGEYIRTFDSVGDAAASVGAISTNISNACAGRSKSSWDHIWKYTEPEEPVVDELEEESKNWIILEKYPLYRISRDGRIYSTHLKRLKIPSGKQKEDSHLSLNLVDKDGNKNCKEYIHRLVAMSYLPKPKRVEQIWINHKDGDKTNNNVENLEWCTPKENAQHAHDNNLCSSKKITIHYNEEGEEIARYDSLKEAAEANGITTDSISKMCRNGKSGDMYPGEWKYEEF